MKNLFKEHLFAFSSETYANRLKGLLSGEGISSRLIRTSKELSDGGCKAIICGRFKFYAALKKMFPSP